MSRQTSAAIFLLLVGLISGPASAADWSRFRGPNGSGVSPDSRTPPVEWSDTKNLKWKVELPGPGHSSPIVVGDRLFVTCWSGYGVDNSRGAEQKDLRRHVVCLDRISGKILWNDTVEPVLPEEPYRGMFAEHGYASHTPVSDGEKVFVFFGKTGVLAYTLDGKKLWQVNVGNQDDDRHWGTASSPILYKNLVIVPATIESRSLIALDKETGKEVWKQQADGFASTWGTPVLVDVEGGRQELVLGVPYEIWGFNPDTGKLLWYCETVQSDSMCSSVVAQDGVVYAIEGRGGGGTVAVRAGGKGDVTKTHLLWSGREAGRIGSPVFYDHRLYWISGGIANCVDAKTGDRIYQSRVRGGGAGSEGQPPPAGQAGRAPGGAPGAGPGPGGRPGAGFGPGGGPGRGGRGGMGGQDYSSAVAAGDKLYFIGRSGESYVIGLDKEFKLLATNRFESDRSDYSATPAISDGQLFIRSKTHLYCVSE